MSQYIDMGEPDLRLRSIDWAISVYLAANLTQQAIHWKWHRLIYLTTGESLANECYSHVTHGGKI